jgi:predicted TIM-barrel fold metal-dependent hydrolase
MRIDAFTHFAPPRWRDEVLRHAGSAAASFENWTAVEAMTDLRVRLAIMDEFAIDAQVLCTPSPPLDEVFSGARAAELARRANDATAELVSRHGDRFITVATISMTDLDAAADETERAVRELGMKGVLLYTSHRGKPLDRPELEDYYSLLEELDAPVWLHPERSHAQPDYTGEDSSRFGIFLVFRWPYETTVAMARLVLSGVLERHPRLHVVVHHAGAFIPRLINRIGTHYANQPRIESPTLSLPVAEYFRRFHVDTVTQGSTAALAAAADVFGVDRLLFATDFPFGGDNGRIFIRHEMRAVESLRLDPDEANSVWGGNLMALLAGQGA